jgi:hypothetical protein
VNTGQCRNTSRWIQMNVNKSNPWWWLNERKRAVRSECVVCPCYLRVVVPEWNKEISRGVLTAKFGRVARTSRHQITLFVLAHINSSLLRTSARFLCPDLASDDTETLPRLHMCVRALPTQARRSNQSWTGDKGRGSTAPVSRAMEPTRPNPDVNTWDILAEKSLRRPFDGQNYEDSLRNGLWQ